MARGAKALVAVEEGPLKGLCLRRSGKRRERIYLDFVLGPRPEQEWTADVNFAWKPLSYRPPLCGPGWPLRALPTQMLKAEGRFLKRSPPPPMLISSPPMFL